VKGRSPRTRTPTYELHGLRIRSEIALSAPVCRNARPDVAVRWGNSLPVPSEPAPGDLIAALSLGEGRGYSYSQTGSEYTLRYHRTCEFRIDDSLRSIRVHLAPSVDPALASLLLAGQVSAFLLTLKGECVLHASAVKVGTSALAFVGASGMGKSTLAALLCAKGAQLITDDLLRVAPNGDGLRCFPGTSELRLRPGAAFLARRFPKARVGSTVDGRIAVRFAKRHRRSVLLSAVVIPRPSKTCRTIELERLATQRAFLSLTRYTAIASLTAHEPLRRRFLAFARIATATPVYEARIPWAPPMSQGIATDLLRGVGISRTRARAHK